MRDRQPIGRRELRTEVVDERRNVVPPLAQRWHVQVDDVQPVEQVLAEDALPDHLAKVAVGGRHHPHVDVAAGAVGAHFLELAGFQEAQEQPLHAQRHLADFVEKRRPLVGGFELAGLVAIGPREAPFDVAEELGFEECLGDSRAIDRREHLRGAGPAKVNGAGDDFLAYAALPRNEHFRVGARHAVDLLLERNHRGTLPDQLHVRLRSRGKRAELSFRFDHVSHTAM